MVPRAGLEPARLTAADFESAVSTGSTTGAWDELYESVGFNARWIENTRGEWRGIGRVGTMIRHEHSCGRASF